MNAAQAVSGSRRATFSTMPDLSSLMVRASVAMSVPFNLGGEAAAGRVVRVDAHDVGVGEQFADARVRFAWLRQDRFRHHSLRIEAAQRQHSLFEYRRNLVDIFGR